MVRATHPEATLRRILFATNFSAAAQATLPHAARLARLSGAVLQVVHVIEVGPWEICPEVTLQQRIEATRQLDAIAASPECAGIHVDTVLRHGGALAQLLRVAEQHAVDLIVTGRGTQQGLRRALLGSIAEKLAGTAPCPVMTVRPRTAVESAAVTQDGIKNIVLATGLNAGAAAGIAYATSFAERFGAKLWIAHCLRAQTRNNGVSTSVMEVAPARPGVRRLLELGSVEEVTVMLARRESPDLVMLAPGLGGLLPELLPLVDCPVMTVRYAIPMIRPQTFGAELVTRK